MTSDTIFFVPRILLGLGFFFLPGFLISHSILPDKTWSLLTRFFAGVIFSLTTVPLILFELFHFGHYPVTPALFTILNSLVIFITIIYLYSQYRPFHFPKIWSTTKFALPSPAKISFLAVLFFGAILITIPLFFKHQPLPGPDTPVYLYNSALIYGTHQIPKNLDRSVVYLIPPLLSYATGLTVYTSLKLMIIIFYLLSGISVYLLSRYFFSPHLSSLAMFIAFIDQGLLSLSVHIFAFEIAVVVINLILIIFLQSSSTTYRRLTTTLILTSWLWGLLFNLHGIVSFGSFLIIGLSLGALLFHHRTLISAHLQHFSLVFLACSVIFVLTSVPLIYKGWNFVYRGIFMPITGIGMNIPESTDLNQNTHAPIRMNIVDTKANPVQVPALRNYYLLMHSASLTTAGLIGSFYIFYQLKKNKFKNLPLLILFTSSLGYFFLTQQQYLGIDWYSGRFVMAIYPQLIILAIYGLEFVSHQPPFSTRYLSLNPITQTPILLLLSLPLIINSYDTWQHKFISYVDPNGFQFYQQLPQLLDHSTNHTIFYSGTDQYWAIGLNPKLHIIPIKDLYICNVQYNNIGYKQWAIIDAFCDSTNITDSVANLTKYGGDPHYYVVVQGESSHADLSKFTNDHYRIVYNQNNLYLFQKI